MMEVACTPWRIAGVAWPLPNVWLGTPVVNQEEADRDIPKLLETPARVRFLSIEPMLGPINLGNAIDKDPSHGRFGCVVPDGAQVARCIMPLSLDWIIAGGESGPGARPAHPDWLRSLRDQCTAEGVPFLFKQWGEWLPTEVEHRADGTTGIYAEDGSERSFEGRHAVAESMARVGKKAAGRLLDGVEHNWFPR